MEYPFDNPLFVEGLRKHWRSRQFGVIRDSEGRTYFDMCVNCQGQVYTVWENGMGRNIYAHIEKDILFVHGSEYVAELRRDTPSGAVEPVAIIPMGV